MIWQEQNISFEQFVELGRNRAGTLIEVLSNGKKKQHLIGDITENGKMSGARELFKNDAIVLRYKILWSR